MAPPATLKEDLRNNCSLKQFSESRKIDASLAAGVSDDFQIDLLRVGKIFEDFLELTVREARELVIQEESESVDMLLLKELMCLIDCERTHFKSTNRQVKQFFDSCPLFKQQLNSTLGEYVRAVLKSAQMQFLKRIGLLLQIVLKI